MPGLMGRLGMDAFRQPSVFGFYLPEHRPQGEISDTGLVSPESEILTTPKIINYLNGMNSLIEYGLTQCYGGFGHSQTNTGGRGCARGNEEGRLNFVPTGTTPTEII